MNSIIRNKLFGDFSALKFHFGTVAFQELWPEFPAIFDRYNSAEKFEEKLRLEAIINDHVEKVLKLVDQKNILEKKLEGARKAAKKLTEDTSILNSKTGKLGRANTKTEAVTQKFFSLLK